MEGDGKTMIDATGLRGSEGERGLGLVEPPSALADVRCDPPAILPERQHAGADGPSVIGLSRRSLHPVAPLHEQAASPSILDGFQGHGPEPLFDNREVTPVFLLGGCAFWELAGGSNSATRVKRQFAGTFVRSA